MKRLILAAIAGAIVSSNTLACADTPPAAATTTLHIDAATIVKSGAGSQSVILIPGLSCGPFVYDNVVRELGERFTVYTVSFAGFDGIAPVKPPYLDLRVFSATSSRKRNEIDPDSVGAVLAVDTLPPLRT